MIQVDEMPTSGRFAVVFECDNGIHTFKMLWIGDVLYEASEKDGSLDYIEDAESLKKYHKKSSARYFIEED